MKGMILGSRAVLLSSVASFALVGHGQAQTTKAEDAGVISEIVVTAEKRETTLQKTAIAITAVDGDVLQSRGKTKIEDVLRDVPGVTVQTENNSSTYTIRGIRPATSTDPAVNMNRDGVFQSNSGANPSFDVARVEVLKGPQGTLYGRNAIGGVVNIVNEGAKPENGGYVSLMYGNYDAVKAEGAVNLKLSDALASRTALFYSKRDGYLSNGNSDDDSYAIREKLWFEATSRLNLGLTGEYSHSGGHGPGTVAAPLSSHPNGDPNYSAFQTGAVRNQKYSISGLAEYDFGGAVLTILPAYYHLRQKVDTDLQGQGLQSVTSKNNQNTQEVRLSAPSGSKTIWQIGTYHLHYNQFQDQGAPAIASGPRAGGPPSYEVPVSSVDSLAAFGQATYPLTDALRVTGGLRYTQDTKTLQTNTFAVGTHLPVDVNPLQRVRQSAVTWKAGVEYDIAARSLVYADVSKGFKSGGLNQLGVPAGLEAYDPEELIAYEAGSKNRFLDNRLQINADIFYYDYSKKQFQAVQPRPMNFPLLVTFTGAARVYGAEVEAQFVPTPRDRFTGAVAYNNSKVTDFNYPGFPSQEGQRVENTPLWSGNIGYEHTIPMGVDGELTAGALLSFQSGTDTVVDVVADDYQKAFHKVDLTLSYHNRTHDLSLTAFINNVGDKTTRSRGFAGVAGLFPDTLAIDPPRTYGVSLRKGF